MKTMNIKVRKIYVTTDAHEFRDYDDARKWQSVLDYVATFNNKNGDTIEITNEDERVILINYLLLYYEFDNANLESLVTMPFGKVTIDKGNKEIYIGDENGKK